MSGGLKPGSAGGASLSDATPAAPGTAAAGVSTSASRGDHVHTPTTAAQAGALATSLLTTRGDLIRRGASAAERFSAVTADTFVGGDGTDVTTRTAAQVVTSLAGAPYSLTTAQRLALSAPANGTRIYDSTVDRTFVRQGGLWVRDDGAVLYGNQPGGDTSWTSWSLGSHTTLVGGALRWINPTGAAQLSTLALAGIASARAFRMEWQITPISGWSSASQIFYVGTRRGAFSQAWMSRCRGGADMTPYTIQASGTVVAPATAGIGPTTASPTVWQAIEISGGIVRYEYGTGTGTGASTPPAASEWKLWVTASYASFVGSSVVGATSFTTAVAVQESTEVVAYLDGSSAGSVTADLSALTIYPIGGGR